MNEIGGPPVTDYAHPEVLVDTSWVQQHAGDDRVRVIEIGSWEGRSALFFLNFFPRSRITCIDTFAGSSEHQDDPRYSART